MMLENKNIIIFSHPRTGTKLLAKIFEKFDYHIHGEWFSLLSAQIKDGKVVRREKFIEPPVSQSENQFVRTNEYARRLKLYTPAEKNVITVWPESLSEFPFLLYEFSNYHWVCLRRDPWETMLSWYISSKNNNFDGLKTSQPFTFKEDAFRKVYWDYHRTNELQDWLVANKSATLINFEDLVSGNSKAFGARYPIDSKDEHTSLEPLVLNLEQVKEWYEMYETKRKIKFKWN